MDKDIFKTLAWFNIFSYPLTAEEVWRYFPQKISLGELKEKLASCPSKNSYYFLPGREELVEIRLSRQAGFFQKLKKAQKVSRYFSFLPFVEAVFFSNIIGQGNLRAESDLDFLLVVKPGRLWLVRFLATWPFKILGMRPRKNNKKNKVCLSFYLSADSLDLRPLMLREDPYFCFWLASLFPLYDPKNVFGALWQSNPEIKKLFPNLSFPASSYLCPRKKDFFLDSLDNFFSWWQKLIMPKDLRLKAEISPRAVKLYLQDRREELALKYKAQIDA